MLFDLKESNVMWKVIEAANPQNFMYSEAYSLRGAKNEYVITESIRTLTILSISAAPANLYTDLFHGWKVADQSPLTFHQPNLASVVFCSNWTIRARFGFKSEEIFEVNKPNTFLQLKSYLL